MKILVALDGSAAAFNAMRSACGLAVGTGSYITAFYVNKGAEYSPEETAWTSIKDRIVKELESVGNEIIHQAYEIGRTFHVPVEGIVSEGIPAVEICRYVNAHGIIKLVAMGHSSKGRGAQEFVESTTRSVLVQTGVPVFVASSGTEIRRLLIAVDDTEVSRRVAEYGGRLAKSLGADVGLISFVPDPEALINEYRMIAEVPNIERHIEASEKAIRGMIECATTAASGILGSMDIRPSVVIKRGQSDDIVSDVRKDDLLIIGVKAEAAQKKPGRLANRLLHLREISAIFVQ